MGYQFIKWFNARTKEDVAMVGGKGANLGELTRAGIRVPPGFCVTADAYQYFVKSTGLQVKIRALLAETDLSDVQQLDENTAKIRQMIV